MTQWQCETEPETITDPIDDRMSETPDVNDISKHRRSETPAVFLRENGSIWVFENLTPKRVA